MILSSRLSGRLQNSNMSKYNCSLIITLNRFNRRCVLWTPAKLANIVAERKHTPKTNWLLVGMSACSSCMTASVAKQNEFAVFFFNLFRYASSFLFGYTIATRRENCVGTELYDAAVVLVSCTTPADIHSIPGLRRKHTATQNARTWAQNQIGSIYFVFPSNLYSWLARTQTTYAQRHRRPRATERRCRRGARAHDAEYTFARTHTHTHHSFTHASSRFSLYSVYLERTHRLLCHSDNSATAG